ncbi:MAG TPA: GNAT family N-acetyltransferase [Dehalococcoidia bacterium]|nr:GNAT family N-acetyltransferase [Dehalococcoidia bacterium]
MVLSIDPAMPRDVPLIMQLIRELAEYEHEAESARATAGQIEAALFGERPVAEAVIARVDGEAAGWALWFQNFSTWTGKPGLWLEDLFVRRRYRRQGVGRALLVYLARLCVERDYGRFEWSVLDWNTPAIEFYDALGAEAMSEWTTRRLSGEALRRLADTDLS